MATSTRQTYRQRVLRVQLFLQEHLDEELPRERLARLAHFSPCHFHRVFAALVGEPVSASGNSAGLAQCCPRSRGLLSPPERWRRVSSASDGRRPRLRSPCPEAVEVDCGDTGKDAMAGMPVKAPSSSRAAS